MLRSFDDLRFDFNELTELLSSENFKSKISSNYLNEFILQASYQIIGTHTHIFFKNIIEKIVKEYNLYNTSIDADLYVGFTQATCSIIHHDDLDVLIYGLHGETTYVVNKKPYLVKAGDLIKINKGEVHQAIGITPRILLSIGVRENINKPK